MNMVKINSILPCIFLYFWKTIIKIRYNFGGVMGQSEGKFRVFSSFSPLFGSFIGQKVIFGTIWDI